MTSQSTWYGHQFACNLVTCALLRCQRNLVKGIRYRYQSCVLLAAEIVQMSKDSANVNRATSLETSLHSTVHQRTDRMMDARKHGTIAAAKSRHIHAYFERKQLMKKGNGGCADWHSTCAVEAFNPMQQVFNLNKFEDRASRSQSMHDGESSTPLCEAQPDSRL